MDRTGNHQGNGNGKSNGNGKHHESQRTHVDAAIVVEDAAAPSIASALLSKERKKSLAKPREGGDAHFEPLAKLYEANPAALGTAIDVAKLRLDFARDSDLARRELALAAELQAVRDERLVRRVDRWEAQVEIYKKALATKDLRGEAAVRDFATFMKNGPRKKKDAPPNP